MRIKDFTKEPMVLKLQIDCEAIIAASMFGSSEACYNLDDNSED
jgi:hypothetical protein